MPGLYNPLLINTAGQINIIVHRVYKQLTTKILERTVTLLPTVNWDIFNNPRNTNGPLATTTNISPLFVTNRINEKSYAEIKFTPSRAIANKGGMYIFFPQLPTTSPNYYLLPPQN